MTPQKINPMVYPGLVIQVNDHSLQKSIDAAGGYYIWRDECILENLKVLDHYDRKLAKSRLNRSYSIGRKRPPNTSWHLYEKQILLSLIDADIHKLYEALPLRSAGTISATRSMLAARMGYVWVDRKWVKL